MKQGVKRSSLFRSDNEHIRRQIGENRHMRDIMTPFALDSIINVDTDKSNTKKRSERGTAKAKKSKLEFLDTDDEAEEEGLGDQLFD